MLIRKCSAFLHATFHTHDRCPQFKKTKMIKIYIIVIFSILAFSCTNKTKITEAQKQEKIIADSIADVNSKKAQIAQEKRDSILDIEQMKVIGDIEFLMSETETKEKIKEFIKKSERTKYSNSDLKYPFIGNYEFSEFGMKGSYNNDKLYMLKITGSGVSWEKYENKIPKELAYIKQVIELKYGEPEINRDIPQRYLINEDENYLIYSWQVGVKSINIVIHDSGQFYKVNVIIYLPSVAKMINERNQQMEKNVSESDKDVF